MKQVQVRVPEKMVEMMDTWIGEGKFTSRSDVFRTILTQYEERERTRKFYEMLRERSQEAKDRPVDLIPLE